jgi:hypothetical protein
VTAEWLLDYGIFAKMEAGLNLDESTNLDVATVGIRMPATQITFPNRVLRLRCMARLGSQQWEEQRWAFLVHHHMPDVGEFPCIPHYQK